MSKEKGSFFRHPLVIVLISIIFAFLLERGYDWTVTAIKKSKVKPNETRCAVVFLEGDTISERHATIIYNTLREKKDKPLRKIELVPKEASWFRLNFLHLQISDTTKEKSGSTLYIGFNDTTNTDKGKWLFDAMRFSLFRIDTLWDGDQIRRIVGSREDKTLPFNKPGHELLFHDVYPATLMGKKLELQKYAVSVVVPPYAFYKEVPATE
jgi:hypothetical protein